MESRPKKLLDQVRDAIRVEHYARNTEQAYVYWIKKYIVRASLGRYTTEEDVQQSSPLQTTRRVNNCCSLLRSSGSLPR